MSEARIAAASRPAEIERVRALFLDYARSLGFSLCFQGFDAELATLPGAYAPPAGGLWLAWSGAEAVGCVGLRPLEAGDSEMKRLYVAPAARGRGLGRRLAEQAIARARELGYRRLLLDTLETMTAAQALYAELGFVEVPPYYDNPLPGASYWGLDLAGGGADGT